VLNPTDSIREGVVVETNGNVKATK
jgi:hypothetical protein